MAVTTSSSRTRRLQDDERFRIRAEFSSKTRREQGAKP
jgi:hypothetical protein